MTIPTYNCIGKNCNEEADVFVYVPYLILQDMPFCLDCEESFKILFPTAVTIDSVSRRLAEDESKNR